MEGNQYEKKNKVWRETPKKIFNLYTVFFLKKTFDCLN